MEYLILILLFAVAMGVTFTLTRRRAQRQAARPAEPEGGVAEAAADPRQLGPGDAVGLDGATYRVAGTLRFDDADGYHWQEHLLAGGESRLWLSVEETDGGELLLVRWERLAGATLEPGTPTVTHDGTEYELLGRGSGSFTAEGETGTAPAGTAEYADYAAGRRRLGFERYGSGGWEVLVGDELSPQAVAVSPGGGAAAR